jgi:hypothetical protein
MVDQPLTRILGIIREPQLRAPEAKTVSPGIHVRHESIAAHPVDLIGGHDLQIAHSRFFEVISTRVAVKLIAALIRHANSVASLMQQRVNRRIATHVHVATDDTRFLLAPETSSDRLVTLLQMERQVVICQQSLKPRQR